MPEGGGGGEGGKGEEEEGVVDQRSPARVEGLRISRVCMTCP